MKVNLKQLEKLEEHFKVGDRVEILVIHKETEEIIERIYSGDEEPTVRIIVRV